MKILVISNLPPFVIGGAEYQAARLCREFIQQGHRVEVAGYGIPSGSVEINEAKVKSHRIWVLRNSGRLLRGFSYALSLVSILLRRRRGIDIVYCRFLGEAAIVVSLLKWLRLLDMPLVCCPASGGEKGDANFMKSIPGWRLWVRLINRYCDVVNIISPYIETTLIDIGLSSHLITRIPNGIELRPVQRLNSRVRYCQLIFVGRLAPQKGLDALLAACAQLASRGRQFELMIIGSGSEKQSLKALCSQFDLEDQVRFVGRLSANAVREQLLQADVFVLPSRFEGLSNAALEAMEAALPVVLTRCGGIDSYVGPDVGWVCEPDDVTGLALALADCLDKSPDELQLMGAQARKIVENCFNLKQVAERHLELFKELIQQRKHLIAAAKRV